ncbi:MAG: phosphoenolpyruvate synthase [Akkermansiaceae bacterium]|nr:phosphoenolpyruvate synthase [Akkermansiaceae bacterium]
MKWTLPFADPLAVRPEFTGGKGANLASLATGEFPVPPGFVLVGAAYRSWLDAAPWWRDAERALPVDNSGALETATAEMRERLRRVPLPEAVAGEVRGALAGFSNGTRFAVRSSSTMEDLTGAAFAGQHDTFLNCAGPEAVLAAVHDCYLSLWHHRAIAYCHRIGLDHGAARMAVVIQKMEDCDAAGVGFSMHPVTGDLATAVVEANFGLGESVVSGGCVVDHWELEKCTGRVVAETIARKTVRTVPNVAGGVADEALTAAEGDVPALTGDQLAAINGLLCRAETWFRFPQDIEWGLVGDQIVLLQSRAVTTIPARWTRDESAERFPNVITPLTWDFVDKGFHRSMDYSFRLMGFPRFSGSWFGKHGHYVYGNQNAVDIYAGRFPFAIESLDDLPQLIPRLREEFRWVQELPVHWSRDLDYYLIRLGEFMAEPLEGKSIEELWRFVLEVNEHGAQYFLPNIAISVTQAVLYRFLQFLLAQMFGPEEVAPIIDGLLAFCETKTGAINKELYELAEMLREDPMLERRFGEPGGSRALWDSGVLAREHGPFHERFERVLRDHGHREIDLDPYHAVWAEVPWVVLDQVRLIRNGAGGLTPAQRERELKVRAQTTEFRLFQRIPVKFHFFMHELIRLARVYTSLDDLEHYQTTRLTVPLRKGLKALGQRLVDRGILAEPLDVFFARMDDITAAVTADTADGWAEFSALVAREKKSWEEARNESPGWVPDAPAAKGEAPEAGTDFTGLPGSPGVTEGTVFIVSGPHDFAECPRGAVLVARTTNPTWTPLFYTACAVVTESGGPLSHGAVTAREMQIPAVMSVRDCLNLLSNGCRVRVDGSRGIVTLLDGGPEGE